MVEPARILFVDDDPDTLRTTGRLLETRGYLPLLATDGEEGLRLFQKEAIDLVLADRSMPGMSGEELLRQIRLRDESVPFILLTGFGDVDSAVTAMREGADDYLQKPCDPDTLTAAIERTLAFRRLREENRSLKASIRNEHSFATILTQSPAMHRLLDLAARVARSPETIVALYGESGVGKEVLARAIHVEGESVGGQFVPVNCAGIPAALLESELFGHVKGAFTGADRDRPGRFDAARNGTLMLDEIGDMPMELQAKILRVLQERTYERVGSNESVPARFRVIVATHRDLGAMTATGEFRADLYHRINVFPLTIPPLRKRREDIPLLAEHYLHRFATEAGRTGVRGFTDEAMERMIDYRWPGNVRELRNCVERAAILVEKGYVTPAQLQFAQVVDPPTPLELLVDPSTPMVGNGRVEFPVSVESEELSLERITTEVLRMAYERCGNNKSKAAELLKVDRGIFYRHQVGTSKKG